MWRRSHAIFKDKLAILSVLTLHFGARADVRALIALSAFDSSTNEMVAFSSSRAIIYERQVGGGAPNVSGRG